MRNDALLGAIDDLDCAVATHGHLIEFAAAFGKRDVHCCDPT
jgi:hypothetical protein